MNYFNYILLFAFCLSSPVQLMAKKNQYKGRQSLSVDIFPFVDNAFWNDTDSPKNWTFMYTRENANKSSFFDGSFRYGLLAYVDRSYDHQYYLYQSPAYYHSKTDNVYGRVGFFLGHQWDFPLVEDKLVFSGVLDVGYWFTYRELLIIDGDHFPLLGEYTCWTKTQSHDLFLAPQLLLRYDFSRHFSCALGLLMHMKWTLDKSEENSQVLEPDGNLGEAVPYFYPSRKMGVNIQPVLNFYYRF